MRQLGLVGGSRPVPVATRFTKKFDAERHLVRIEGDKLRGNYVAPRRRARQLPGLRRAVAPPSRTEPPRRKTVEQHLRCYVYYVLGARALSSIRPSRSKPGPRPRRAKQFELACPHRPPSTADESPSATAHQAAVAPRVGSHVPPGFSESTANRQASSEGRGSGTAMPWSPPRSPPSRD